MELFGTHGPPGSDGYQPGAWDEVKTALLDGSISEEAYEKLRETLMVTVAGETWRHTLSYAATALEASSDNGDQYCAAQIRQMLSDPEVKLSPGSLAIGGEEDTPIGRVLELCDESERQWEWNRVHDPEQCVVPVFNRQVVETIRAAVRPQVETLSLQPEVPVLDLHAADQEAESTRYADAVERWSASRGDR